VIAQYGDTRLKERIWKRILPEPNSGCWIWTGSSDNGGYGTCRWRGRNTKAHIALREALVGDTPVGLELDHLCRTRCCVNPLHLEPVTARENVRRGTSPAARYMAATFCKNGHPFDEANTRRYKKRRYCKTCMEIHSANWKRNNPDRVRAMATRHYYRKKAA
jgi:hypothetical protein